MWPGQECRFGRGCSLKKYEGTAILVLVLGLALGFGAVILIFASQKDKHPATYWKDEDFEQIVVGERPTNERMQNVSVNLRSPIRKVYVASNSGYVPRWSRENRIREAGNSGF